MTFRFMKPIATNPGRFRPGFVAMEIGQPVQFAAKTKKIKLDFRNNRVKLNA